LPPLKFFAYWSYLGGGLGDSDQHEVCRFVDYAVKNSGKWKRDTNAMLCLLEMYISCPSMKTETFQNLHKKDECREVMRDFAPK
jgi:hypothetical protein